MARYRAFPNYSLRPHLRLGLAFPGAGAAAPPPPPVNNAREFNGTSSDYLSAADSASLRSPSAAITIAFWMRITSATQVSYNRPIYKQHGSSSGDESYELEQSGTSVGKYIFYVKIGSANQGGTMSASMLVGNWYFVVIRWASGGAVNLDVYNHDGSLFTHVTGSTGTGTITYGAYPLFLGNESSLAYGFKGDLARVFIDNTSLSDPDVATLLSGTLPKTPSAGYWPLGLGSPDPDQSGHGNDCTVYGTTIVAGP